MTCLGTRPASGASYVTCLCSSMKRSKVSKGQVAGHPSISESSRPVSGQKAVETEPRFLQVGVGRYAEGEVSEVEGRVLPGNGKLQLVSYTWLLLTKARFRTVSCARSGAVLMLARVQGVHVGRCISTPPPRLSVISAAISMLIPNVPR